MATYFVAFPRQRTKGVGISSGLLIFLTLSREREEARSVFAAFAPKTGGMARAGEAMIQYATCRRPVYRSRQTPVSYACDRPLRPGWRSGRHAGHLRSCCTCGRDLEFRQIVQGPSGPTAILTDGLRTVGKDLPQQLTAGNRSLSGLETAFQRCRRGRRPAMLALLQPRGVAPETCSWRHPLGPIGLSRLRHFR
jgi:hypothetical protein